MKNTVKLLLAVLLAFTMCLSLVGCFGDSTTDTSTDTGSTETSTDTGNGNSTDTGNGGETTDTSTDSGSGEEIKPTVVTVPRPIDSGACLGALEAVHKFGFDLTDKAVAVYEIHVEKNGEEVSPDGKTSVSVPALLTDESEYEVYHILENGEVEKLTATTENGMITFETESFSDFVFASTEKNALPSAFASSQSTQLFTLSLFEKYDLLLGILGISSLGDVTVYLDGKVYTCEAGEGNSAYVNTKDFYKGQKLTVEVVPNNGYIFANYALLNYVFDESTMEGNAYYSYYTESKIEIKLDDTWDGIMSCELFAPDADRNERDLSIYATSEEIDITDITFTVNGVEMKGECASEGGYSYELSFPVKDGDVITIEANLVEKLRFEALKLYSTNGDVISASEYKTYTFSVTNDLEYIELSFIELEYLGLQIDCYDLGWRDFNGGTADNPRAVVAKGSLESSPADFGIWIYTDDKEYLLDKSEYSIDMGGFDINTLGVYNVVYTYLADPTIKLTLTVLVEEIKSYDFSTLEYGEQYANEENTLGEVKVSTHNNGCHFNTQLRIYANENNDGYAVIEAPGAILYLSINAGYKNATLEVYGSRDGEDWYLLDEISVTVDYASYQVDVDLFDEYKYLKLDATGAQVRVASFDISYTETK